MFGACYCDMFSIGHRPLKGLHEQITLMVNTQPMRNLLQTTLDLDTRLEMGKIRQQLDNPVSEREVIQWDKDVIKQFLKTIYAIEVKIEDQIRSLAGSDLGTVEYIDRSQFRNDLAAKLLPYLKSKGYKVMSGFLPLMLNCLEHSFSPYNLCEHQLEGQIIFIRGDSATPRLRDGEIAVRLYVLSAITFPHENALRYPGHPNAPEDLSAATGFEAMQGGRIIKVGGVGVAHYSENMGAIHFVQELAEAAKRTADLMDVNLESFRRLASIRPQPCAMCDSAA